VIGAGTDVHVTVAVVVVAVGVVAVAVATVGHDTVCLSLGKCRGVGHLITVVKRMSQGCYRGVIRVS
jgi:hypothetical protein